MFAGLKGIDKILGIAKRILPLIFVFIFSAPLIARANPGRGAQLTSIDLREAGRSVVLEVHVSAASRKIVNRNPTILALQIVAPKKGQEYLLPRFDGLVFSVTGTHYRALSEQEIARPAERSEIKLHVAWRNRSNNSVLKEGDVSSGYDWQGKIHAVAGPSFTLDSMNLPPGDYEIIVTTLSGDSRFDGSFATGLCVGTIFE